MKIGIGLPTTLVPELNRGLLLDWARTADRAGFHVFGTIDRPNYDSWDPLASLAAAAAVTERVRLATTILQLPPRSESLVAKQAAVIDRLSGGRLDLGIGIGSREDDYKALGARFAGRGKKVERQIRKIRRIWRAAKRSNAEAGLNGPAPLQKPLPPIWIGGRSDAAVDRAVEMGDGYVFGVVGPQAVAERLPSIRERTADKKRFDLVGVAYVAIGEDPDALLDAASKRLTRYYGQAPPRPVEDLCHRGPADVIAGTVAEYEQAGLDVLILFPLVPDVRQVEQIGDVILPAYRVPAG
ncbi:MAG TPA: LLM class flavin-dependent oxidoreductase [Actinomycetota bacterium]